MRICSLLPSATEILFAVGAGPSVCGVTYGCDYPPEAKKLPAVVFSRLPGGLTPAEIDTAVRAFAQRGESQYYVDGKALHALDPDLILTQELCDVCAASPGDLSAALGLFPSMPKVLSLTPHRLFDVAEDIRRVGEAAGSAGAAREVADEFERQIESVRSRAHGLRRPLVVCLEWLDPPFVAGHWVPDMVEAAGGTDALGKAGLPSFRTDWQTVFAARPEIVLVMPCGYSQDEAAAELSSVTRSLAGATNTAFRALNASGYFSRPGPRLAAGVEQLLRMFHPEIADGHPDDSRVQLLPR